MGKKVPHQGKGHRQVHHLRDLLLVSSIAAACPSVMTILGRVRISPASVLTPRLFAPLYQHCGRWHLLSLPAQDPFLLILGQPL